MPCLNRRVIPIALLLVLPLACRSSQPTPAPSPAYHVDLRDTLTHLAADDMEGRGIATEGINRAADYIAGDLAKLGLQPLGDSGTYFQSFQMTTATKPAASTRIIAAGKSEPYEIGKDYIPVSFSAEGNFEGDIAFAGYGISNPHLDYDDYAELEVKGKVVVVMRFEPHNDKGRSRFTDEAYTEDATLARKVKVAGDHGASAIVFVNPPNFHPGEGLMPFAQMFMGEKAAIPMLQVTAGIADQWLKNSGAGIDLKAIQEKIDTSGKPFKVETKQPVRLSGHIEIERVKRDVKNIAAFLPGTDRDGTYVVIGAHYDHLGRGGPGSLSPRSTEIHNGADDNASGTTMVLALAEHYAKVKPRPKRSIVFVLFTAEESGLIGSNYFVNHPPMPLDKAVAMFNLDMVGRVRKQALFVGGQGTAPAFDRFIKDADDASPLELKSFGKGGFGPSDHMSFALKKVPVLFFFSGIHSDYHRPTDDADKINYEGMQEVLDLSIFVADRLLTMPKEQYVEAADVPGMASQGTGSSGFRATLGIMPDYGAEEVKGLRIQGTSPESPARKAGLVDGDVIVKFNGATITSIYSYTDELRKTKPGDTVKLEILRDGKTLKLEATLTAPKE